MLTGRWPEDKGGDDGVVAEAVRRDRGREGRSWRKSLVEEELAAGADAMTRSCPRR